MKGKRELLVVDKIILWINFFLCTGLLFSYIAPVVNPQKIWIFAFFGLAFPVLLMANIIMVIYWLLRKKWPAIISIIFIVCGWKVLENNIGFNLPGKNNEIKEVNAIRMMTYNVHNFKRYGAENDTSTKHAILEIIKQQQPDIIGIQEFYTRKSGAYDMRDSILSVMGASYCYFEPVYFNVQESIGIAIFSKLPIIGHGSIPIADKTSENACIYADLKYGDQKIRVYSVHLQSIGFDPEDYKYINSIKQQGKPDIYSTRRLGSKLKSAFLKRSIQVAKIKAHAAICSYSYIISGDFNDTPSSFAVNEMAKGLKNAFTEKGFGLGRTYNGSFPNYQIDYIMASPQFEVKNYTIIEKKLSDHFPVRSDLVIGH